MLHVHLRIGLVRGGLTNHALAVCHPHDHTLPMLRQRCAPMLQPVEHMRHRSSPALLPLGSCAAHAPHTRAGPTAACGAWASHHANKHPLSAAHTHTHVCHSWSSRGIPGRAIVMLCTCWCLVLPWCVWDCRLHTVLCMHLNSPALHGHSLHRSSLCFAWAVLGQP